MIVGWPRSKFEANRTDYEAHYMNALKLAPGFAERMRGATRETRFAGIADLPNFFRKPYGPGWALVGDAGHHKDPITALGISDAFRDADAVSAALDDAFAGRRPYDEAMAGGARSRGRLRGGHWRFRYRRTFTRQRHAKAEAACLL